MFFKTDCRNPNGDWISWYSTTELYEEKKDTRVVVYIQYTYEYVLCARMTTITIGITVNLLDNDVKICNIDRIFVSELIENRQYTFESVCKNWRLHCCAR